MEERLNFKYLKIVADAGYKSKENYSFIEEKNQIAFIKPALKYEIYYLQKFYTYEELRQAIDEYIVFYNTERLQKNLKGLTPIEYRNQTLAS